jgi:hypothetical protein
MEISVISRLCFASNQNPNMRHFLIARALGIKADGDF